MFVIPYIEWVPIAFSNYRDVWDFAPTPTSKALNAMFLRLLTLVCGGNGGWQERLRAYLARKRAEAAAIQRTQNLESDRIGAHPQNNPPTPRIGDMILSTMSMVSVTGEIRYYPLPIAPLELTRQPPTSSTIGRRAPRTFSPQGKPRKVQVEIGSLTAADLMELVDTLGIDAKSVIVTAIWNACEAISQQPNLAQLRPFARAEKCDHSLNVNLLPQHEHAWDWLVAQIYPHRPSNKRTKALRWALSLLRDSIRASAHHPWRQPTLETEPQIDR